jgi:hypothetical protein
LDATKFIANSCSTLTPAQLTALGLVIKPAISDSTGCRWSDGLGNGPGIQWVTSNTNGLADLYVKKDTFAYWIPTTIAGYPAVYGDALADQRADGSCVLNVGVNDHLYFFIGYSDQDRKAQACDLATQTAAYVIATIKGGP